MKSRNEAHQGVDVLSLRIVHFNQSGKRPDFFYHLSPSLSTRPAITLPACDNRAARPESNRQPVRKNRIAGESSDADRLASLGVRQPRPDSAGWCLAAANQSTAVYVRRRRRAVANECTVVCCGRVDGRTSQKEAPPVLQDAHLGFQTNFILLDYTEPFRFRERI